MFRFLPLEIVFAFCDSLKYIQIIYIAKWVNRRYLITYCSFFYIGLGFIDGWSKAFYYLWIRKTKYENNYQNDINEIIRKEDWFLIGCLNIISSVVLLVSSII
jgi:hypothetical protein